MFFALVPSPDFLAQRVVRHDEPHTNRQNTQQAILLWRELDWFLVKQHFSRDEIDGKRSGSDDGIFHRGLEITPQGRFAAHEQLWQAEPLDYVIVGVRPTNAILAIAILRRCVYARLIQAYPDPLLQDAQPWGATPAPHARGWPETSRRAAGLQISRCRR